MSLSRSILSSTFRPIVTPTAQFPARARTYRTMSDRALRILTSADVDKVLDNLDQKLAVDSQRAVFAAYSTAGDAEDSESPPLP